MEEPSHIIVEGGVAKVAVGVGFTVMVNVRGKPVQVTPAIVLLGMMVMVATTGLDEGLIAMKDGIVPVPEAANPIEVLLFVQLKIVPVTNPVKGIGELGSPLHTA